MCVHIGRQLLKQHLKYKGFLGSDFDELLQLLQVALPDAAHHDFAANK